MVYTVILLYKTLYLDTITTLYKLLLTPGSFESRREHSNSVESRSVTAGDEPLGYSYEACEAGLAAYGGFVGIAQTFTSGR